VERARVFAAGFLVDWNLRLYFDLAPRSAEPGGRTSRRLAADSHETHGTSYLSLKTVSALFIGLGFGGAIFNQNGFPILVAAVGGLIIGILIATLYLALMNALHRLRSDGTALLWEAIGRRGRVYMRIPANESAPGEIQVAFGGRFMNVKAFTRGPELSTGTDVLVISVHGENALEVAKVSENLTLP
jgi:hypothetical protein